MAVLIAENTSFQFLAPVREGPDSHCRKHSFSVHLQANLVHSMIVLRLLTERLRKLAQGPYFFFSIIKTHSHKHRIQALLFTLACARAYARACAALHAFHSGSGRTWLSDLEESGAGEEQHLTVPISTNDLHC